MGNNGLFIIIGLFVGDLLVMAVIWFFINRYFNNRLKIDRQNQADTIIANAKESAKSIEIEAKDKAISILDNAERGSDQTPK